MFKTLEECKRQTELKRGSGECIRCGHVFPEDQIEAEFRVALRDMSKLSLICKQCRKEVFQTMRKVLSHPNRKEVKS